MSQSPAAFTDLPTDKMIQNDYQNKAPDSRSKHESTKHTQCLGQPGWRIKMKMKVSAGLHWTLKKNVIQYNTGCDQIRNSSCRGAATLEILLKSKQMSNIFPLRFFMLFLIHKNIRVNYLTLSLHLEIVIKLHLLILPTFMWS